MSTLMEMIDGLIHEADVAALPDWTGIPLGVPVFDYHHPASLTESTMPAGTSEATALPAPLRPSPRWNAPPPRSTWHPRRYALRTLPTASCGGTTPFSSRPYGGTDSVTLIWPRIRQKSHHATPIRNHSSHSFEGLATRPSRRLRRIGAQRVWRNSRGCSAAAGYGVINAEMMSHQRADVSTGFRRRRHELSSYFSISATRCRFAPAPIVSGCAPVQCRSFDALTSRYWNIGPVL